MNKVTEKDPFEFTRYERVRLLTQGGYGDIYLVRNRETHQEYAAKLLQSQHLDKKNIDRFRIEAQAAWLLDSPYIIRSIDFDVTEERRPFYTMPHLAGLTLAERIQKEGALDPDTTASILIQVLSGLETAHAAGIVHRDLCPDNIFLHQDGGPEAVKILDFGFAKLLEELAVLPPSQVPTPDDAIIGKSGYVSPEQTLPGAPPDLRVDLYAVGVILHECVTGAPPAWKSSSLHIPEDLRKAGLGPSVAVPEEFDRIARRALHPKIEERFQTAAEFRTALEEFHNR